MCSSQFNLTRMFLNSFVECSLGVVILLHLLVNCLRVDWIDCLYVCRVFFDCASHQRCTVGIYCASAASEWPCFQRTKGFFFYFFPKKMDSRHKKIKKNSSRQPWRQPDVSCHTSAPPHLTTDVSPWQLWREGLEVVWGHENGWNETLVWKTEVTGQGGW